MKKLFKIALIFLIMLMPILGTKAFATNEATLQKIEVVSSETGTYKTGEVITIKLTYSDEIEEVPKINIKFGMSESYGYHVITEGEISKDTVTYKHTIGKEDSGELSVTYVDGVTTTLPELTGSTIKANPMEWTETSKFEISIKNAVAGQFKHFNIEKSGLNKLDDHNYFEYITHTAEPPVELTEEKYDFWTDDTRLSGLYIDKYLEENGDIYYWLYEEQMNYETGKYEQKLIVEAKKLERPALNSLGQRMTGYFFDDHSLISVYEPVSDDRKVNIKIGKVTDTALLRKIKNNEINAMSELMDYAKKSTALTNVTLLASLNKQKSITHDFNLENGAYYYAYYEIDDENGKYYPIKDIELCQGRINSANGEKHLLSRSDDKFVWNLDDGFSDFSNAKATLVSINATIGETTSGSVEIAVHNVKANTQKKHKFYYYLSNDTQNIPEYDSDLWKEADSFKINEETGECIIYITYEVKGDESIALDFADNVYVSIYEVISDTEITTEKIEGMYKLGLESKAITWGELDDDDIDDSMEDEDKTDGTTADVNLPHTGLKIGFIVVIIAILGAGIACIKYNGLKNI